MVLQLCKNKQFAVGAPTICVGWCPEKKNALPF